METLPLSWTVHTCDQEGDGAGLLKGGVPDTNTRVCDLFHEDAQVGLSNPVIMFCLGVLKFSTLQFSSVGVFCFTYRD